MLKSTAIALVACGITSAVLSASVSSSQSRSTPDGVVTILRFQPSRDPQNAPDGYVSSPVGDGISENHDIRGQVLVRYKPQANDTTFVQVNVENLLPETVYGVHVEGSNGTEEINQIAIMTDSDGSGTYSTEILGDAATGAQVTIFLLDVPIPGLDYVDQAWIRAVAVVRRTN